MRFGVCGNIDEILTVKNAKFDFIETSLSSIMNMSDEEFERVKEKVVSSGLRVEAFNCFFPGDMSIIKDGEVEKVREYTSKALKRAVELGGEIAVMGSGGARRKPDDMDIETFNVKFERLLNILASEAENAGITVVLEPLSVGDTNTVNTIKQAKTWVEKINHPNLRLLADTYHMYKNGESFEEIEFVKGLLSHIHIARGEDRGVPQKSESDKFKEFAQILNKINYNGRISVEAIYKDFENELTEAYHFFNIFRKRNK